MSEPTRPGRARFPKVQPRLIRAAVQDLAEFSTLDEGPTAGALPLVVRPTCDLEPVEWARGARGELERRLLSHGAVLFRGFDIPDAATFGRFAAALSDGLIEYGERAAERRAVSDRVYTSTAFPPEHEIPLHHEMSYTSRSPSRLWLYCARPAASGGCTPIADDRNVIASLPAAVKAPFIEKGVLYVRNYGTGVDLDWRDAFQVGTAAEVDAYCRRIGARSEWSGADRLRTWHRRPAVVRHPTTGDEVWFNHAHLFHSSSLDPLTRDALRSQFAEDELPRNAFFGDGTTIPDALLDEIRDRYQRAAVRFQWQERDVLMVDNFLAVHGRDTYTGERRILVTLGDLYVDPRGCPAAGERAP